jgi:hypothetical protein
MNPIHIHSTSNYDIDDTVDHLRSLATKALLQSPSQAAFTPHIVRKTGSSHDALLAQAICPCKYAACLRILEESALLPSTERYCCGRFWRREWSNAADCLKMLVDLPILFVRLSNQAGGGGGLQPCGTTRASNNNNNNP